MARSRRGFHDDGTGQSGEREADPTIGVEGIRPDDGRGKRDGGCGADVHAHATEFTPELDRAAVSGYSTSGSEGVYSACLGVAGWEILVISFS